MRAAVPCTLASLALSLPAAMAQPSLYDPAAGLLSIPSVSVGAATYTAVTLAQGPDFTFTVRGATPQVPAAPGVARYDPATGLLSIPSVKVGSATYLDVTLRDQGNLSFALAGAVALPAATESAVKAAMSRLDALWSEAVPPSGAARYSVHDGCYAHDGRTRGWLVADIDANLEASRLRDLYLVGRRSTNVQVLAMRTVGSGAAAREEFDISYDTQYTDGSSARDLRQTLVRGDTRGLAGCSSGQSSTEVRLLGNQRLVSVGVRAVNQRDERHSITTGAALSPAVNYRRSVQFPITDPLGRATYVVVSGPGPAGASGQPFSLKLLSPRVARSAPEMQGRQGNFINWADDDTFRICRITGSGAPVAAVADCAGVGTSGSDYGLTTSTPDATADRNFAALGYAAGGVYRFDVHADDGWKTVNGHAGKVPIATYHETLDGLPYAFVDMAGSGVAADRFPRLAFGALTHAQVLVNANLATPAPIGVSWNEPGPMPDGTVFGLFEGWEFHQGARASNPNSAFNPAFRQTTEVFPGSRATTYAAWPVTPKLTGQTSKSYIEFTLQYQDRNGRRVNSLVSFQ